MLICVFTLLLIWICSFWVIDLSLYSAIVLIVFVAPFLTNGRYSKNCFYKAWIFGLFANIVLHGYFWYNSYIVQIHDIADIGTIIITFLLLLWFVSYNFEKDIRADESIDSIFIKYSKVSKCINITGFYVVIALIVFYLKLVRTGNYTQYNFMFLPVLCFAVQLITDYLLRKGCKKKIMKLNISKDGTCNHENEL